MDIKKNLRQDIKKLLLAQTPVQRKKNSRQIQKKLFGLGAFKKANCVAFYVSMPQEVDTLSMIPKALAEKKRVVAPRTIPGSRSLFWYEILDLKRDLKPGPLGILEPNPKIAKRVNIEEIDCVIVPGLCFDRQGRRLGRGAGFYDRFLHKLSERVPKIGLAFGFQMLPMVPCESHDERVDWVLTDEH